jgi:uncharacterized protein (TIGR02246 family)
MAMKAGSNDRIDLSYPTNRVVGTVGDADKTKAAIDSLLQAGFERQEIEILHGEEDLQRLDRTGVLAQFQRSLSRNFDLEEFKHLTHHLEDVRAGRFVIMVLAKRRDQRIKAADILNRHGAEFVGFYGRWAWVAIPSTEQTTPEEIPALFARAWNAHDPDALAALFDEDGEFVSVTGLCWHNRESIRKGHADRVDRTFGNSTLSTDATTVKLLSPEVALVHARMTCSGQRAADGAAATGPRTTILSLVVHRIGERWLCASAHTSDVNPEAETSVSQGPGVLDSAAG